MSSEEVVPSFVVVDSVAFVVVVDSGTVVVVVESVVFVVVVEGESLEGSGFGSIDGSWAVLVKFRGFSVFCVFKVMY